MHCLVTGANGYIGGALLSALSECGHLLSVQVRSGPAPSAITSDTRCQECDFSDRDWNLTLDGVDVLFHLAGIAHQQGDQDAYQAVNVDSSLALMDKAIAAGVRRFVFVSSVKASAAEYHPNGELVQLCDAQNPYAQSKALAEVALEARCRDVDIELVIVRPALVYSDNAVGHLRWLRYWTRLHLPTPPPGGERSMIALSDLVTLLAKLVSAPIDSQTRLTATDGERYSTRRLHRAFCAAAQRQPWFPSPPAFAWRVACRVLDRVRKEPPGRSWARITSEDCYCASGLDALGFRPTLNFESSLGLSTDAS